MFYLGLDLGKLRDFAALALIERKEQPGERICQVRYLERAPLGTPYTKVVERVAELTRHRELQGQCYLTADATCLGEPVMEMLRAAKLGSLRGVTAVSITSGEQTRQTSAGFGSGESWNVPRADLLSGLQLLLEKSELKIARSLGEAGVLVRELVGMRTGPGGVSDRGEHDDLALAVALACWEAGRREKKGTVGMVGTRRLF